MGRLLNERNAWVLKSKHAPNWPRNVLFFVFHPPVSSLGHPHWEAKGDRETWSATTDGNTRNTYAFRLVRIKCWNSTSLYRTSRWWAWKTWLIYCAASAELPLPNGCLTLTYKQCHPWLRRDSSKCTGVGLGLFWSYDCRRNTTRAENGNCFRSSR
jgi:hypothetical protein